MSGSQSGMFLRSGGGFTLVELAIVMTIIGLLTGGVLKGLEMVKNARMTATIEEVQAIDAAIIAFRDKYSTLPGDYPLATQRLEGCNNFCVNGNGDGRIGLLNDGSITGDPLLDSVESQAGIAVLPQVETTMIWTHLVRAGITNNVTGGDPLQPEWGVTHPASKLRGGYQIGEMSRRSSAAFFADYSRVPSGHYMMIRHLMLGGFGALLANPGAGSISPRDAMLIDRKMDDGDAGAGRVVIGGWLSCMPSSLAESDTRKNCVIVFRVGP